MNYYNEIKNRIIDNEVYCKVKDNSKERNTVITYFEIGRLLNEAGGKYGDNVIDKYSEKLIIEVGTKYNRRTLFRMKQFFLLFNDQKVSPLATQLTWSHYSELLSIKNRNKLIYYINLTIENNLSKRQLREKIKNNEYERLPLETKSKLINSEKIEISDLVPNPILIQNKSGIEIVTEKVLHSLILKNIEDFMKELCNSFSFIGSEYKIKNGNINM